MPTKWEDLPRDAEGNVDFGAIGMVVLDKDDDGNPLIVKRESREYKGALMLRVSDLDKARKHLGDEAILEGLDGQSFRVAQQDVSRNYLIHCATQTPSVKPIRETYLHKLWDRLTGIRSKVTGPRAVKVVTVTVVVVNLPSGARWEADAKSEEPAETQLRSAWLADLMDEIGMAPEKAMERVAKMDADGKFAAMLVPPAPAAEATK